VLPTKELILVVHDWGSALGFDWARQREDRIVGLAFMEFIPPMTVSNSFGVQKSAENH
jgi:haloalkane dehalogenase